MDGHAKGNKNTPYLQKLSNKRAFAVRDELARQGVKSDHIKCKGSGAVGRGMHVFITVDHIGTRVLASRQSTGSTCSRSPVVQLCCLADHGGRLRADESERPQNVTVSNDLSRLTSDEELVRCNDISGSPVSILYPRLMVITVVLANNHSR